MEDLFHNLRRMTLKDSMELKMEAENGEWGENERIELMCRYQRYHDIVEEQAYVIRGSVLSCEYGTKEVRIDCTEDHGVYVGNAPLMTCGDCQHTNIHEFGSCMCPESNYVGRLPITPSFFMDLSRAEKAPGNNLAHVCRPLINLEQGWRQINEDLLVESHAHMTGPALLNNAVLVCNYGGIIRIREVPEKEEDEESESITYLTLEQLKNIPSGWSFRTIVDYSLETSLPVFDDESKGRDITQEDVDKINSVLTEYEINTPNRIAHFLSQAYVESQHGFGPVERYDGDIFEYFAKYETEEKKIELGNTEEGDGAKYRGAGALHMTGKFAYKAFSEYMGCPQILDDGALYVGKEYFWESAGFYWKIYKPSTAGNDMYNLNKICDEYEDIDFSDHASVVESVTAVTHVINAGENKLEERIEAYKYFISLFL